MIRGPSPAWYTVPRVQPSLPLDDTAMYDLFVLPPGVDNMKTCDQLHYYKTQRGLNSRRLNPDISHVVLFFLLYINY